MRILLAVLAVLLGTAPHRDATAADLDTSMLVQFTPTAADLPRTDSVALAYLAKGWTIAGRRDSADILLNELERRGRDAYGIGKAHAYFPPIRTEPNPADTVYTVTLVQVADAYRAAGRTRALAHALAELDAMPKARGGACWPYSTPDAEAGCVHNVNAISIAFLSRLGRDVTAEAAYERATMIGDGAWYYWEHSPPGYWAYRQISDAGHLGWQAFELLDTTDPDLQDMGRRAATYLHRTYVEAKEPHFAHFAVAAATVAADLPGGCAMAAALPQWATRIAAKDPDVKSRQWGAFVHVWAQVRCHQRARRAQIQP